MSTTAVPPSTPPSSPSPSGSPSSSSNSATPTDNSSSNVSSTVPPSTPTSSSSPPVSSSSPGGGGDSTSSTLGSPTYPTSTTRTAAPVTTPDRTTSTSTIISSSLLTESSTSVYAASSTITSDGYVYTTQISVTTVLPPGSVVTSTTTTQNTSGSSSNNTGAIVGGVIGGIAALALLGLLCYFLFNKRRRLKDEFDGNFDPLAVSHNKHSPHPSFGGAGTTSNAAGRPGGVTLPQVNVDDDDGMGGRIARGPDGGGVISPYPFASPPNQPLPASHHPQMSQSGQVGLGSPPGAMMALGAGAGIAAAGAYNNERPQNQGHHRNPSNLSSVSGGNYPASVGTTNNGVPVGAYFGMPGRTSHDSHAGGGPSSYGYQGQPGQFGQYLQGQQYPQGQGQHQQQLSPTNTTSSGGGYANYNNYNPYAPPMGRGPSPGPSVGRSDTMSQSQYSSSSAAGGSGGAGVGGRMAKEIEAFGGNPLRLAAGGGGMMGLAAGMPVPHVVNPDEARDGQQAPGHIGQQPTSHYSSSTPGATSARASSTTVQPTTTSQTAKPGLITLAPSPTITSRPLVQHQDGGRVEEVQANPEATNEIPPAYDSLPQDIRR